MTTHPLRHRVMAVALAVALLSACARETELPTPDEWRLPTQTPPPVPVEFLVPTVELIATSAPSPTDAPTLAPPSPTPHATLTATPLAATEKISPEHTARQRRVFDTLWGAVNTRYVYTNFNGLDWNRAYTTTADKIHTGLSNEDFYRAMDELVVSLNDDHSNFLAPDDVKAEQREFAGDASYVGIGARWDANIERGYAFVLQAFEGSPADRAGILAHDHILKINGESAIKDGKADGMANLRGAEGTTVTLTVRTPGREPREVVVTRAKVTAAARVEYRLVPNAAGKRIGYVLVPTFFEQNVAARVRDALRAMSASGPLDAVIVDVRINGGGAYTILSQTLGLFTGGPIGQLVNRNRRLQTLRARANNVGNSQSLPLAVLVGPSTASFAEVFAGALQARKRAALIGSETAGNIETLLRHDFEDGSALWLAEETFQLPDGSGWEGKGLRPDVRAEKNWDEFSADDDPAVKAALDYFASRR